MLSPLKLYKHDMPKQHIALTRGMTPGSTVRGKPKPGCTGSVCYRHKNLDWAVHRLGPAVYERAKPGGPTRKILGKATKQISGNEGGRRPKMTMQRTSPRWGEGKIPGRKPRKIVPLPKKGTAEVSKKTKVAVVGTAGAGTVAVKHNKRRADGNHGVRPYH